VEQSSAKSIASHIIRLFNILPSFRINLLQNALPRSLSDVLHGAADKHVRKRAICVHHGFMIAYRRPDRNWNFITRHALLYRISSVMNCGIFLIRLLPDDAFFGFLFSDAVINKCSIKIGFL
jgi:hypothetical protein